MLQFIYRFSYVALVAGIGLSAGSYYAVTADLPGTMSILGGCVAGVVFAVALYRKRPEVTSAPDIIPTWFNQDERFAHRRDALDAEYREALSSLKGPHTRGDVLNAVLKTHIADGKVQGHVELKDGKE